MKIRRRTMMMMILMCPLWISSEVYIDKNMTEEEAVFVTVTVYQATEDQCDSDPFTTAFGHRIDGTEQLKHRYIAISRDLEGFLSNGDSVMIEGTGIYDGKWMVADRMNRRWTEKIDLLINMDSPIGRFENVRIVKL